MGHLQSWLKTWVVIQVIAYFVRNVKAEAAAILLVNLPLKVKPETSNCFIGIYFFCKYIIFFF